MRPPISRSPRRAAHSSILPISGRCRAAPPAPPPISRKPRPNGKKARYRVTSARTPKRRDPARARVRPRPCVGQERERGGGEGGARMTVRTACACASGASVGCCCSSKAVNTDRCVGPCAVRGNRMIRGAPVRRLGPPSLPRLPSRCWIGWRMSGKHQGKNDHVV